MRKPRLAITTGDPAGVGPELALRCAMMPEVLECCVPLIFGDASVLRVVGEQLGLGLPEMQIPLDESADFSDVTTAAIYDFGGSADSLVPGKPSAISGQASFNYVTQAIDLARRSLVDGIVTGPIQKEAWHAAGIEFPGHTELLVQRCDADKTCMMLTSEEITCSLVTIHVGLGEVAGLINEQTILETIQLTHDAVSTWRGRSARIAVCGLNPHAGEGGMFGNGEEESMIRPAIESAARSGINVLGPLPPDTAFLPSIRRETDAYVCMYHDQGLIPLKTLSFDTAVNITLGLPIVRTSVDHGTALDIAWQGKASSSSMVHAIRKAAAIASGQS